jgi:hypothetical protein
MRTRTVQLAAVAVAVAAGVGMWTGTRSTSHSEPVTLPAQFIGIAPGGYDFIAGLDMDGVMTEAVGENAWGGHTYGQTSSFPGGRTKLMVNLVVARADLTGKVDLRLSKDEHPVGSEQCGTVVGSQLICSRTSDDLSVTALVMLGTDQTTESEVAAAVESVFTANR